jgi:xanthine dehydrogenase small subunit
LRELAAADTLALSHDGQRYFAPVTLGELSQLRQEFPDATLLAGGTDVGLWATKEHRTLPTVIAVERVPELSSINDTPQAIEIGTGATYEDALGTLARHWPDMGVLIRRLGARQVRNRGTIGGNIANGSPIGDSMPALIALGATLVLRRGPEQLRMSIEDFFVGYRRTALRAGEFLERIDIPAPSANQHFHTYKVSKRLDQDISAVCAAFRVQLDGGIVQDIRIGFGGMAAIPLRARRTEQALSGSAWSYATLENGLKALRSELSPISDMRSSAAYRMNVAGNLLRKFFLETADAASGRTRLEAVA